jgi:cytochrome c biogenesis protein
LTLKGLNVSDNIPENRDGNPSIVALIWRFFTSIKLALVLIIIVVVLSLVSIFLIQAPPGISRGSPEYTVWLENVVRPDFGIWTDTLSFFGLFDVFHSPLFLGAGVLLIINIICCTIKRWSAVKAILRGGSIPTSQDYYQNAGLIHRTTSQQDMAVLSMSNVLLRHRYRVRAKESEGSVFIAADKHAWPRLGTFISHLSLILLVLGFLLGSFLGFRDDSFVVAEGMARDVGHGTGLSLGLISFSEDYWSDGMPREYSSDVIVYQDDLEVDRDVIRVNHPLTYSGVRFYQSFFGPAAVIKVTTAGGVELVNSNVALIGMMEAEPFQRPLGRLNLPGTGLTAYLVAPAINTFDAILAENQIGLEIYQGDATVPSSWVILEEGMPQEMEGLEFIYVEKRAFSGFSVKYDPAAWLVWLAVGLFLVSISLVLYLPFRQVWIMIKPEEYGSNICIRSSARRGLGGGEEIEKIYEELAGLLPSWSKKTEGEE